MDDSGGVAPVAPPPIKGYSRWESPLGPAHSLQRSLRSSLIWDWSCCCVPHVEEPAGGSDASRGSKCATEPGRHHVVERRRSTAPLRGREEAFTIKQGS